MNAKTTRILKEARALSWPWCAVMIGGALPLFHISHSLNEAGLLFTCVGIPLLATLPIDNELRHRTLSLLLSQPVSRMEIWREKLIVTFVAVLTAALVFCYARRSAFQEDPKLWVFLGVLVIASIASGTCWGLFARTGVGFLAMMSFLVSFEFWALAWLEGPKHSPAEAINSLSIGVFAALCYAGVMLWLGGRKLARFQVAGGMAGDDLLMAGPSVMPEALAGWFRYQTTGPSLNLIRKELRFLRPLWLITPLFLLYLTCLTIFRFVHLGESAPPHPKGVLAAVLFTPVLLFTPLIAILAGSLSLGEERASGTHSWHMTVPVSARRQWLIKLGMALFTGLVCAVLLPVLAMVAVGLMFGSPFMFVDQAMMGLTIFGGSIFGLPVMFVNHAIPGLLLTALVLTFASFWCACAVNGTARAGVWFAPAMSAVLLAGRYGDWIAPRLVDLVVSRIDPFTDFRFTNAVLNLQLSVMFATYVKPLRVVTLLFVPTLFIAVIQSYRLFREQARDSIMSVIRNLLPLAITAFLSAFCLAAFPSMTDQTNGTIVSSGVTRRYLLYVPKTYDRSKATPLVISLHGGAGWPAFEMHVSRWNEVAEQHGFIVAYPAGSGAFFGGFSPGPSVWRMGPHSLGRDVRFISDLIDKLGAEYNIDPTRIYADGMSNGGGMAFALSCRLSDRIAAVGAVAAAQSLPWNWCKDSTPVPMVAFHGTADPLVPYQGGLWLDPFNPMQFPAVRDWAASWARRNRCGPNTVGSVVAKDVTRVEYTNCAEDAAVVLYTIQGGGHTWPGGKPLPEWIVGRTTREISATSVMWEFFVQHRLGPK